MEHSGMQNRIICSRPEHSGNSLNLPFTQVRKTSICKVGGKRGSEWIDAGTGCQQPASSLLSFLLSPSSYVTLQWKQSWGGNKQAMSFTRVSAAVHVFALKAVVLFCSCMCSYMDVLCAPTRKMSERKKKMHKMLAVRPRASGSCSTHRGSFVCHGRSVPNTIITSKVTSSTSEPAQRHEMMWWCIILRWAFCAPFILRVLN